MRILLTGANGFIGSKILETLVSLNYDIVIIKRSFSDIYRIKNLLTKVKSYDVDKTNLEWVFKENPKIEV